MTGPAAHHIESRLKPGGKYEMATQELQPDTRLRQDTVVQLKHEAAQLNRTAVTRRMRRQDGGRRRFEG